MDNPGWKSIGEQITGNLHLNRVLLSVPSGRREEFYNAIRPFLRFEPKPSFRDLQ
jgi:hypothetical protein